jgi:hypothetical protein
MAMYTGKVKVKMLKLPASVHAKKAHIGCGRDIVPLILNLEVSWRGAIDHLVFCSRICVRVGVSPEGVVSKTQTFEEERRRKGKKKQKQKQNQTRKEKLVTLLYCCADITGHN